MNRLPRVGRTSRAVRGIIRQPPLARSNEVALGCMYAARFIRVFALRNAKSQFAAKVDPDMFLRTIFLRVLLRRGCSQYANRVGVGRASLSSVTWFTPTMF